MSKFHQKVSIELDVEFEVSGGLFGRCNVKVESLVEEFNRLISIAPLSPLNQRFNQNELCIFLRIIPARLIDLINKLELLFCVI